jgi:phosphoenolpyruvate carboxykinase (diphosphate)
MELKRKLGIGVDADDPKQRERILRYINLKLASMGLPYSQSTDIIDIEIAHDLIENYKEKNRLLSTYHCPVDKRIQDFLDSYLSELGNESIPQLPVDTLILDRYGLSRELSLPSDKNEFITDVISSYRIKQGVLHNPKNDKRTTKGSFHVAEGGLPIPFDKKSVPKKTFAYILNEALNNAPEEIKELPFTSTQKKKAKVFLSVLLKPVVVPEVKGFTEQKCLDVRFFAPGNMVCNLDFVESIFGNAGDPYLPENDSALDPDHWTGHTGCVILAPHLTNIKKIDAGLPNIKDATDRQKADGMCWESKDELYNDGTPFKLTARNEEGVIITLIADNYFGYCKKEVKTQIGYSANLLGLAEEEHAGGAMVFPRYNLGTRFVPDSNMNAYLNLKKEHTFENFKKVLGENLIVHPEGHGLDKNHNNIVYIPENTTIDLETQTAKWINKGQEKILRVLPGIYYIHPSGYQVTMEKHPSSPAWRLVGTVAEGTFCHKPCTVSGGGKSEISKSISDAMTYGSVYVGDFEKDMDKIEEIINYDYSSRFNDEYKKKVLEKGHKTRSLLSEKRSLGSVIKLLSPSPNNTDEFNSWLTAVPLRVKALVFAVKRFYEPHWDNNWRERFSVDIVNNEQGHVLRYMGRELLGTYLKVGSNKHGNWITNKVRQDFLPAAKVQLEDDISASIVVPASQVKGLSESCINPSVKIVENCENRFFQRPDDAVHRGFDKQAEADLSTKGNFISNFEPLKLANAVELYEKTAEFYAYTEPVRDLIIDFKDNSAEEDYFMVPSHPRIVADGPSKNPRYLQVRPDLIDDTGKYLSEVGTRLFRQIPSNEPCAMPVNAVLAGRRNNPADHEAGIRPLAVYGPIHFQELPELFMDFICSLTGKSPSTTGAGSEGALTKAPFNALVATSDLNNALLSFILTGYNGYTSAAGYIGSEYKVDHDISLLIPELWSRMSEGERDPYNLIKEGFLDKVEDFDFNGQKVLGSRLGYRLNKEFLRNFMGRIFDNPEVVFTDDMLKPELQGMEDFVDGINNIVEAQQKVAKAYIADGTVNAAIPPLKAILHIMAEGNYEGKTANDPEIRKLFDRDYVINSDWYKERLAGFQKNRIGQLEASLEYLKAFLNSEKHKGEAARLDIPGRIEKIQSEIDKMSQKKFLNNIEGTIGLDPLCRM